MTTTTETRTLDRLYAACPLQQAIVERCSDHEWLTDDEEVTTLRDMASGHDPIYQFVGMIPTEGIVIDLYNEYKADVIEAIAELASYGNFPEREARSILAWSPFRNTPDTFDSHAEFAGRCLKIALDYHAGELASQTYN